jgi:hypothetical protein
MKFHKTLWLLLVLLLVVACSPRIRQARDLRDSAQNTHNYFVAQATLQAGNESERWREANKEIVLYNQRIDVEDQAFMSDVMLVGAAVVFVILAVAVMSGSMSSVIIQIRQRETGDYGKFVTPDNKPNPDPPKPPGNTGWRWVK